MQKLETLHLILRSYYLKKIFFKFSKLKWFFFKFMISPCFSWRHQNHSAICNSAGVYRCFWKEETWTDKQLVTIVFLESFDRYCCVTSVTSYSNGNHDDNKNKNIRSVSGWRWREKPKNNQNTNNYYETGRPWGSCIFLHRL